MAQGLSGLAVLLSPIFLVDGWLLSTDMLQPLTWLACSWLLVRLVQMRDERMWMAFGVVVGISLASKYLIVFYLIGLAVGVIATPLRRSLLRPWIYAGVVIAAAMTTPNFLWQVEHGWPFLDLGNTKSLKGRLSSRFPKSSAI
jgi:4-amino-4-deoxy-L-arabinose transferase-like glycosyltransferase